MKRSSGRKALLPVDEHQRLKALYDLQILDTDAEDSFDRITRVARVLFGTKICAVSLIDSDRQWFKSICGLDLVETPREIAFCAHTIQGDDPLIVLDATTHPLFKNNPLVLGPPPHSLLCRDTAQDTRWK